MKPTRRLQVVRVSGQEGGPREDEVVVEEPLEIRVAGETLAVTMRTPGHDRELVLGFLVAEGIVRSPDDVSALAHCEKVDDDARGNVMEVTLAPGVRLPDSNDEPFARRGTMTTSACGVCGRRSIDDLLARSTPVAGGDRVRADTLTRAVQALRDHQPIFAATGGCHAASLVRLDPLARDGATHVATFEDVGRHNAVDKVVGSRLRARALPLGGHALLVSGRSSFEIVQKAAFAGIPIVASVSAASSLAVEVARRANVTLVGFTRGEAFTVYTGAERIG